LKRLGDAMADQMYSSINRKGFMRRLLEADHQP
jgi:hypothetical protein